MPSKAYLKALKEIPKDIQDNVIEAISIANEIHLVLQEKNMRPADLARLLDKSESEISKWLTGMHNFTHKTVRKIENVLETKLLVPSSHKIAKYEEELEKARKLIEKLRSQVHALREKLDEVEFNESLRFTFSSSNMKGDSFDDRYMADFIPFGTGDKVKIKAETKSTLSYQVFNC